MYVTFLLRREVMLVIVANLSILEVGSKLDIEIFSRPLFHL